ncbi:hypothetical protein MHSWG343_05800 [Candidatus Mycoplasma haematohominis]|uniref:Lipoprotein n=1 Tax=Candidatus Mycoplasma haematohominis TaxID=1494318 RepID=A0A478FQ75_9MOLU|nr:hypothetical protein MHSWG343_05800 [Candidatus Mycoplasma haemohominis]
MDPVKGAAALGAGAVVVGGGYMGYSYLSISCTTIDQSKNSSSYNVGTIGGDNKGLFVDPLLDENKKWWDSVFEVLKNDQTKKADEISSEFKLVDKGFKNDNLADTQHLNKVCETAIKKNTSDVINSKYLKNIWTYCSVRPDLAKEKGNEPLAETLAKRNNSDITDSHLGSKNKDKLVANDAVNENWWKWVFENRLNPLKTANGQSGNQLSSAFSSVTEGYNTASSNNALNKVCEDNYKKGVSDFSSTNSDANKYQLTQDVKRFCTVGGNKDLSLS